MVTYLHRHRHELRRGGLQGARRPRPPPPARCAVPRGRPNARAAVRGAADDDPVRGHEAPRGAGAGRPRRHPPRRPQQAALPQPGSDPGDPRPVDQQVRRRHGGGDGRPAPPPRRRLSTEPPMTAPRHIFETYIRATPEAIWRAITDPDFTRRYFHRTAVDSSFAPGAAVRYALPDGEDAVVGVIEEVDPPRRLVMTWRVLYDAAAAEEPPSRVEWILTPGD